MNNMFNINKKDLRRVIKFWKSSKKDFPKATAGVLSTFAFETRKENLKILDSKMTIRNKRFAETSIQVEKAARRAPVSSQRSRVGSVKRDRFTGWKEQETGKRPPINRMIKLFARGNSFKKQVKPSMRLKPSNKAILPDKFPGKTTHNRVNAMISILSRKKIRANFIVKGHKTLHKGLYKIYRKRPKIIQDFDKKMPVPKRVRWLSGGVVNMINRVNIGHLWKKEIEKILKYNSFK